MKVFNKNLISKNFEALSKPNFGKAENHLWSGKSWIRQVFSDVDVLCVLLLFLVQNDCGRYPDAYDYCAFRVRVNRGA